MTLATISTAFCLKNPKVTLQNLNFTVPENTQTERIASNCSFSNDANDTNPFEADFFYHYSFSLFCN